MSEGRVLVDADDVHVTRRTLDREETLQPIGVVTDHPGTGRTGTSRSGTGGPGTSGSRTGGSGTARAH